MQKFRPKVRQGEVLSGVAKALGEADGGRVDVHTAEGLVTVRVPGVVPGDRVDVRIRHVGQHANWGDLVEVTTPSPDRVDAPCPVVLRCGGCPWQMVSIDAQRVARMDELLEALGTISKSAVIHDWRPDPRQTGYRTRALMMTRRMKNRMEIGFFAPGTDAIVPVDACAVQHPLVNDVLRQARDVLDRAGLTTWRDAHRPGQLRALLFRVDPSEKTGLLTLVVTSEVGLESVTEALLAIDGVSGVFANLQTADGGAVLGKETRHLAGATHQSVRVGETVLSVGPTAFLQTRHEAGEAILNVLGEFLPTKMAHLLDLYAGVGVFGLALRSRAKRVTLVERDAAGVADAQYNVKLLKSKHVHVVQAAVEALAATLPELAPDAVILDPPRAGCAPEVIAAIGRLPAETHVVYVSCNAQSLARDLRKLAELGWLPREIVPIDMFVHTSHAEWVVKLGPAIAPPPPPE